MKGRTSRRAFLIATGTTALVAASGTVAAQGMDIRGAVEFEGGASIPEGTIEIVLEDPAAPDDARHRAPKTSVQSDGKSTQVSFSIPVSGTVSPGMEIVARLERADGWLLARGSAGVDPDRLVSVTLNAAIY